MVMEPPLGPGATFFSSILFVEVEPHYSIGASCSTSFTGLGAITRQLADFLMNSFVPRIGRQ